METTKLKNIVIFMLLAVNLVLLLVVGQREWETAALAKAARQETVGLLFTEGIGVHCELPKDEGLRVLQVGGERSGDEGQMSSLLGKGTVSQADPGGARITYIGPKGTGEITSGGRFSFSFLPGGWSTPGKETANHGVSVLALLGFEGDLYAQSFGDEEINTYRQLWDKAPIFSCLAELTYRDGSLVKMEGRRMQGTVTAQGSEPLMTLPTALVHFLAGVREGGFVCSEIIGITAGYEAATMRPYRLIPVWELETDTGRYHVGGTGQGITRVE